ncbi:hypothetical protein HAX54_001270, partial [Datura stramonium]|nr:hypothetical protein [Datura stramonium]
VRSLNRNLQLPYSVALQRVLATRYSPQHADDTAVEFADPTLHFSKVLDTRQWELLRGMDLVYRFCHFSVRHIFPDTGARRDHFIEAAERGQEARLQTGEAKLARAMII